MWISWFSWISIISRTSFSFTLSTETTLVRDRVLYQPLSRTAESCVARWSAYYKQLRLHNCAIVCAQQARVILKADRKTARPHGLDDHILCGRAVAVGCAVSALCTSTRPHNPRLSTARPHKMRSSSLCGRAVLRSAFSITDRHYES